MEPIFKCMECDNTPYKQISDLGLHLMWDHDFGEKIIIEGETKFRCKLCGATCTHDAALGMHLIQNHNLAVEIPEEKQ